MARQPPWTLDFDAIIENPDLDIGSHAVVAMKDRVGDDFVQCFRRVLNLSESRLLEFANLFDDCLGPLDCSVYE